MDTKIHSVAVFGSNGSYLIGVETTEVSPNLIALVRRPIRKTEVLGYAASEGTQDIFYGVVVLRETNGKLSQWRISRSGSSEFTPTEPPYYVPYLNLPDEEHGWRWQETPVDLPGPADRFFIGTKEVTSEEAHAQCAAFEKMRDAEINKLKLY